jgi:hypothetical protein
MGALSTGTSADDADVKQWLELGTGRLDQGAPQFVLVQRECFHVSSLHWRQIPPSDERVRLLVACSYCGLGAKPAINWEVTCVAQNCNAQMPPVGSKCGKRFHVFANTEDNKLFHYCPVHIPSETHQTKAQEAIRTDVDARHVLPPAPAPRRRKARENVNLFSNNTEGAGVLLCMDCLKMTRCARSLTVVLRGDQMLMPTCPRSTAFSP